MGFTIEALMSEILQSGLDDEQKVNLLTNLFKKGQLFLIKNEGEDLFECYKRRVNDQGKTEVVHTNFTPEDAINDYAASITIQQQK